MKKKVLPLIMSLALIFSGLTLVSAQDLAQEIEINENSEGTTPRSVVMLPRAFVSADAQQLSISFSSAGALYNVELISQSGAVASLGTLVANGATRTYSLTGLPAGDYILRISNQNKSYGGDFWL